MELTSQKMRKLAPELDPLRLGTGWTPDELSKPQIIVESTFGDSTPAAAIWTSWSTPPARAQPRPAATAPGTLPPTSATARVRVPTASTSASPAAR